MILASREPKGGSEGKASVESMTFDAAAHLARP